MVSAGKHVTYDWRRKTRYPGKHDACRKRGNTRNQWQPRENTLSVASSGKHETWRNVQEMVQPDVRAGKRLGNHENHGKSGPKHKTCAEGGKMLIRSFSCQVTLTLTTQDSLLT